jgi:hypothetical protein
VKWLVCVVLCSGCQLVFDVDVAASVDAGADASGACPAVFEGQRYLYVDLLFEWIPAETHCVQLDDNPADGKYVHLAVLNSPIEFRDLQVPPETEVYIGLTDRRLSDGTLGRLLAEDFLWITDEPGIDTSQAMVSPWASDEPESQSPAPYCAVLRDDGQLDASGCDSTEHPFVCECDDFAENPALIFPGL